MISSIVIARLVDKTQYAYLSYSDTIFGYVTLFSGLGLTSALLKVCAGDTDHNQERRIVLTLFHQMRPNL